MFKVSDKDTRTTLMTWFWYISINDFEQVNISWV